MICIYKDITINNFNYRVYDNGDVYRDTGRKISLVHNSDGYLQAHFGETKNRVTIRVHRLVAYLFCNPPVNYQELEVDHINNIRDDNRACNLEWVTHKENIKRYVKKGHVANKKWENNGRAKLTREQVNDIRNGFQEGYNRAELARKYAMSWSAINCIVLHKTWI